jgi:hypothetical protein
MLTIVVLLLLQLRTLRGGHRMRVGTLAWNDHILTTGGMDSLIINNDVRVRALLKPSGAIAKRFVG